MELHDDVGAAGNLLVLRDGAGDALVAAGAADDVEAVEAQERAAQGGVAEAVGLLGIGDERAVRVVAADRALRMALVVALEVERVDLERVAGLRRARGRLVGTRCRRRW